MSPSIPEVSSYMAAKSGRIAFSDFLEIMHTHRYTGSLILTGTIRSKALSFFNILILYVFSL